MDENFLRLLQEHCDLYNKVERVLKQTTHVTDELDVTVLNELRYAQRALITCLHIFSKSPDQATQDKAFISAWQDAQKGLAIAINDAVDTVVVETKFFLQELDSCYPNASFIRVYGVEKSHQLGLALHFLELKQAETREFRQNRLHDYITLVDSPQLKMVVEFMMLKIQIEGEMKRVEDAAQSRLEEVERQRNVAELEAERSIKEAQTQIQIAKDQLKVAQDSLKVSRQSQKWTIIGACLTVAGIVVGYLIGK